MQLLEKWRVTADRYSAIMGNLLIHNAKTVIVVASILTVVSGSLATGIHFDPGMEKAIPSEHPFMDVYRENRELTGSANTITFALITNTSADIFNPEFFKKLEALTNDILALPEIDKSTVSSLFSPTATYITVDELGFRGGLIVPADFQPDQHSIVDVKNRLLLSDKVGQLVSSDFKGAIIRAEIRDHAYSYNSAKIDYRTLGDKLELIRASYDDDATTLAIIGFSKFIHDIISAQYKVFIFFVIAVAISYILFALYFRNILLPLFPITVALIGVIWQLGLVRALGFGIDPLSTLVPFLIFSIGASHSVQMVSAWRARILVGKSSVSAAQAAFEQLFIPGTTAILGNAIGFSVITTIPLPIIKELGVVASTGVLVMIVTNKFLLPCILSLIPTTLMLPHRAPHVSGTIDNPPSELLSAIFRVLTSRKHGSIPLIVTVVILAIGVASRDQLIIGDADQGAPELLPTSRYNTDISTILRHFTVGLDEFGVIADISDADCASYDALKEIDDYVWMMKKNTNIAGVTVLTEIVKVRNQMNGEGFPKFFGLPRTTVGIGSSMRMIELGAKLFDSDCDTIPIRFTLKDHKAETLSQLIALHNHTLDSIKPSHVSFKLAFGNGGIMAATNEAVQMAQKRMLIYLYLGVFILCILTFSSIRSTLCVMAPLIMVSQFAEAVMAWLHIGLKPATLPVLALGAGVGVDYGIYLFHRTKHYLLEGVALTDAYAKAFFEAGRPVALTAVTLTIGVGTWIFSPLKQQQDMGILLAYMFLVNMVAAFILIPCIAAWVERPSANSGGLNPALKHVTM